MSVRTDRQKQTLLFALAVGQALDRVVILPEFACENNINNIFQNSRYACNLYNAVGLNFIEPKFHNRYREHSFLINPMVPKEVLSSMSPEIHLEIKRDLRQRTPDDVVLNIDGFGNVPVSGLQDCFTQNFTILQFNELIF